MTWRRFVALVGALSGDALWRHWRRQKNQILEGDAAQAFFSTL